MRRRDILHLQPVNLASGIATCVLSPTLTLKMSSDLRFVPSANIAQLRESATIAVSQKAKALKAAGLRVVRVLTINENGGWAPPPMPVMFARAEMASPKAPSPVAAGELEIGANVTVTYELAPLG